MGWKIPSFALFCIFFAYYIYLPIPENIEERWKVGLITILTKFASLMNVLLENVGIMRYGQLFRIILAMDLTKPISDENLTVIDTDFSDIPVRLYLPTRKSERRRPAIIFIHGGAMTQGSCKLSSYDSLSRWTAKKLDAVVLGVDFRQAPQYLFPVPLEDCVFAVKFFLQDKILMKYGVDPTRICITGDSSGGLLATSVVYLLQNDPEFKDKIKAQALIYPVLQVFDTLVPSHQEYANGPFLTREMAIKLFCLSLTMDEALPQAMLRNQHMPEESRHLFKYVNWSVYLPEKYKKYHVYTEPTLGNLKSLHPLLVDSRLSPLVLNDSQLQTLPLTYILTCEHDLVRDDGLIYATRLQNVGVQVTHDHLEDGFHAAISLTGPPMYIQFGFKIRDKYICWLEENL
ncbi:arylacetamide deacetylase-like 2 [Cavia porcellus]|uniref:Alpha/beta hydrolase fold-3 domain-containing protein n=1 Tax=Cavia porcellus TaxID=10141 RepID=H0VQU2_CAVPO|nr:arylacetamide deacetylase-like 2 [Cavia porcellus]